MKTLETVRGDTAIFAITVLDKEGEPYDLTGADIWFSVKHLLRKRLGDGIEIDSPTDGTATITLQPTDTVAAPNHKASYPFDVQIQLADGTVKTPLLGRFVVIPDVTTETPGSS
jgi:hypothetical protein